MTINSRVSLVSFVFVSGLVLALAPWARAQSADGSIRGRVTDQQGAALPGVSLAARSPNTGGAYSAVSDGEGNYRLVNLAPARDCVVSAELKGFARFERASLDVRAGLDLALDVKLRTACLPLAAGGDTLAGALTGVVRDTGGGALVGATVRVLSEAGAPGTEVATDGAGAYRVRALVSGTYRVEAALSGSSRRAAGWRSRTARPGGLGGPQPGQRAATARRSW